MLPLHTGAYTHVGRFSNAGFAAGLLPCLAVPRAAFATHGVGEGRGSTDGGVPRFYKSVHVKEAFEQVGCHRPAVGKRWSGW